jgi:quinohemoprotein ethanol dehydrogenase
MSSYRRALLSSLVGFSPTGINADNVEQLGLAWYFDLETNRGQEATPIEVDGVLYVSTAWDIVEAFEAGTGKLIWSFDPQVPRKIAANLCCDAVSYLVDRSVKSIKH